jgi:hypothetical protein
MSRFKIVPISGESVARIRETRIDDYGYEVIEEVAKGRGPCRISLQPFNPGTDRRLLFSHSPFTVDNPYNQPGPVFINASDVEEYSDIYRFPPAIKADPVSFPITLIGYNNQQRMVCTELVGDRDIDELIGQLFSERPGIVYLHARNAKACCYICTIERA